MSDQDFLEYSIYPTTSDLTKGDLLELRDNILQVLTPYIVSYLWHVEPFMLEVVPSSRTCRGHLRGRFRFGDNVEDEWFAVGLLLRVTELVDVVVAVSDADGEILLIEAADVIPAWAQEPELADGRVFIYKGCVYLIPVATTPAELTPLPSATCPNTDDAVSSVVQYSDVCKAPEEVQKVIRQRIGKYPDDWSDHQHHAKVFVPDIIRWIAKSSPQLLSAAVRAFYLRDQTDVRACRVMKHFPPPTDQRKYVLTTIRFSKCLYAMLAKQKFYPDKRSGWNVIAETDPDFKAHNLGMKLTCGFEMLAAQAERTRDRYNLATEDTKRFEDFLNRLNQTGYFQGEMEGSSKYKWLVGQAKQFYETSTVTGETSDRRHSSDLLRLIENYSPGDVDDYHGSDREADDDSWLDMEQDAFDELLRQHFKLGPKPEEGQVEEKLPAEVKKFLQTLSDFDGVQVPPQTDDMINMDADAFGKALEKALNLATENEETGDPDDVSDDEINLNSDDVGPAMEDYFKSMKQELEGTKVDDDGPESWTKPVNVDAKVLNNLLDSFKSQDGLPGPALTMFESLGIQPQKK